MLRARSLVRLDAVPFPSGLLVSCLLVSASALVSSEAAARREVVSWSHVMPCSVDGFQIRSGSSPGNLTEVIDVGRPRQAGGHFSYELEVPDGAEHFVCVAAVRGEDMSECSGAISVAPASEDILRSEPAADAEQHRLWCQDFGSGSQLDSWVHTAPGNSLVPSPNLFTIASIGAGNQALVTTSSGDDAHSHFLGPDDRGSSGIDWSDYEYGGEMMFADESGGVGATIYSRYNLDTAYYRLGRDPNSSSFQLVRDVVDQSFQCTAGADEVSVAPNVWYAFRLRARDGATQTTLKAKVWRADKREPEGFQWICTDSRSNRQLTGAVGVWTAGAGTKRWDNLSVSELLQPSDSDPLGIPGQPKLIP